MMCEKWKASYTSFYNDMGARPSKIHSIDRIDNNKGYSPDNCRWATKTQQSRNTRHNNLITFENKTMCIADWADYLGLPRPTIQKRFNMGYPVRLICSKNKGNIFRIERMRIIRAKDTSNRAEVPKQKIKSLLKSNYGCPRKMTKEKYDTMKKLRESGAVYRAIGKQLGLSDVAIAFWDQRSPEEIVWLDL